MVRPDRTLQRVILGQFVVIVTAIVIALVSGKFFGPSIDFFFPMFSLPALAISIMLVVAWWAVRPSLIKGRWALAAVGVVAALVLSTRLLQRAGDWLFFETRRVRLERLTNDLIEYRRITELTDGAGYFSSLNHELVAFTPDRIDTTRGAAFKQTYPIERILSRDGISGARYDEFRRRLQDVGLTDGEVANDYVAYVWGGFLDNLEGYMWVRDGHLPPPIHSELFEAELVLLRPLGGGWYWFATT